MKTTPVIALMLLLSNSLYYYFCAKNRPVTTLSIFSISENISMDIIPQSISAFPVHVEKKTWFETSKNASYSNAIYFCNQKRACPTDCYLKNDSYRSPKHTFVSAFLEKNDHF